MWKHSRITSKFNFLNCHWIYVTPWIWLLAINHRFGSEFNTIFRSHVQSINNVFILRFFVLFVIFFSCFRNRICIDIYVSCFVIVCIKLYCTRDVIRSIYTNSTLWNLLIELAIMKHVFRAMLPFKWWLTDRFEFASY